MPFAGLGIAFLYGLATAQYGFFPMADYPVFLGVAAYLVMTGLGISPLGLRPPRRRALRGGCHLDVGGRYDVVYCTWTVSFIFGWMPHWITKSPDSVSIRVACLPGSSSPPSNEKRSASMKA